MNFESSILKKETLSKTAAKEKESLIADFSKLMEKCCTYPVQVVAPFINATKDQVVKKGLELNVPYKYTWSCYEGNEKPCGKCGTCIDRARAFELNGINDPAME